MTDEAIDREEKAVALTTVYISQLNDCSAIYDTSADSGSV
eukprot:UN08225